MSLLYQSPVSFTRKETELLGQSGKSKFKGNSSVLFLKSPFRWSVLILILLRPRLWLIQSGHIAELDKVVSHLLQLRWCPSSVEFKDI
jgi:hypothetical protein